MDVDILLTNARVHMPTQIVESGYVGIRKNEIACLGVGADTGGFLANETIDCEGRTITAGLIDVQVNGGGGYMFSTSINRDHYEQIARAHGRLGVTSICPTIVSGPLDDMLKSVSLVADMCADHQPGSARFAGIHVEGPFLDEAKRGGHAARYLKDPSLPWLKELLEAGKGHIRIVTLAPERPGAMELIDYLVANGVFVSAGHTAADAATMHEAGRHGLRGVTHIFNGMDGILHRVPGVAGVALSGDELFVGLIADLLHVNPETVLVAIRAKRPEYLYLTTDAVSPVGSDATSFDLYGVTVTVRDGGCYTEDGILAGTATPLPVMARNLRDKLGVGERDALRMVTTTPARVLGQQHRLGILRVGVLADVVVFNDDLTPWRVFIDGMQL